jgi:hypothetical protein
VALQPNTGLDAWWQGLGDDPYADPYAMQPLSIASSEGIPAPSPIVAPAYPPEIEMPAVDARPVEQPEIEMPAQDARPTLGFPHAPEAPYQSPIGEPPALGGMQPGLGIPTSALEGFQPQLDHEQAVDDRVAGSERFSDDPMRIPTPEEARENRIDGSEKFAELPDAHETVFDAESARLGEMSPDDFYRESRMQAEQERLDDQQRREDALAAGRREAEADRTIRIAARQRAQQERNQIDADAKALAAKPNATDQDWYEEGGIGRRAGAFLVGLLGGLGKDYRGLDQINRSIDSFLAAKKADRDQQRALLGDRRQSLDVRLEQEDQDWREDQAYKQAALERTLHEVETAQQSFHPEGTRAMELAKARQGIESELLAHRAAANEAMEKKNIAREKHNWEREDNQRKRDENRRKDAELAMKEQAAAAKLRGGGPGKAKPEDVLNDPSYYEQRSLARPPVAMSEKQYNAWLRLRKGSQELAANQAGMSKEERENAVPGIKNADGSTFVAFGRPEDVSALRGQIKAAKMIIGRMDDALRTRTGWSSNTGNSDERKKLAVQWGNAKVDAKGMLDLGAITVADVPLIEGSLGTDDPSSWKDPEAGILEARRIIEARVNASLEAAGYEGARWQITAPSTKKPEDTEGDRVLKRAQHSEVGSLTSYIDDTEDRVNPADRQKRSISEKNDAYKKEGGIPPGIRKQIEAWGSQARGDDKDPNAVLARNYLVNLVETGGNEAVKAAASNALESSRTRPDVSTQGSAVAYETLPPLPMPKKGGR